VAKPATVLSAALRAVIVTVPAEVGAVKSPVEEIEPAVAAQETAVLVVPVTAAVNCSVAPKVKVLVEGLTDTAIPPPAEPVTVTVAVPLTLVEATLVAVIVTACAVAGAVKRPVLEIVPADAVHVTAELVVPDTAAAN